MFLNIGNAKFHIFLFLSSFSSPVKPFNHHSKLKRKLILPEISVGYYASAWKSILTSNCRSANPRIMGSFTRINLFEEGREKEGMLKPQEKSWWRKLPTGLPVNTLVAPCMVKISVHHIGDFHLQPDLLHNENKRTGDTLVLYMTGRRGQ